MQEEIRSSESFLERTDALAKRTGLPLRDLAKLIDISPASLFNYRAGKAEISTKAWAKLKAAESNPDGAKVVGLNLARVQEPGAAYDVRRCEADRDRRLERIEALLEGLAKHLGMKIDGL